MKYSILPLFDQLREMLNTDEIPVQRVPERFQQDFKQGGISS